jgi:hypothetical protein
MTRSVLMFVSFIACSTGGEIIITHAMKIVGEPARLRPREVLSFLGRAFRNGWFWAGLPLLAASFYLLLLLLSWEPISLVIPASALNPYVAGRQIFSRRADQPRPLGRRRPGMRGRRAGSNRIVMPWGRPYRPAGAPGRFAKTNFPPDRAISYVGPIFSKYARRSSPPVTK